MLIKSKESAFTHTSNSHLKFPEYPSAYWQHHLISSVLSFPYLGIGIESGIQ